MDLFSVSVIKNYGFKVLEPISITLSFVSSSAVRKIKLRNSVDIICCCVINQLQKTVVLFRNLALFSCIATETDAVAGMATNAMTSTHGGAHIISGGDVFVTLESH